jgi:hypothetical protein
MTLLPKVYKVTIPGRARDKDVKIEPSLAPDTCFELLHTVFGSIVKARDAQLSLALIGMRCVRHTYCTITVVARFKRNPIAAECISGDV